MLLRLRRLIAHMVESPSYYVRDVDGVDEHLSEVWVGINAPGWKFKPSVQVGLEGALILQQSVRRYYKYGLRHSFYFKTAKEAVIDDGRKRYIGDIRLARNDTRIQQAFSFVDAAAAPAPLVIECCCGEGRAGVPAGETC